MTAATQHRPAASAFPVCFAGVRYLAFGGALCLAAAFLLYRFPPEIYSFYPVCPFHEYLNIECPGCGATRALSALLHGQLRAAIHLNAYAVLVVLPLAVVYAAMCLKSWRAGEPFRWPPVPRAAGIALATLAAAFTLVRNL